MRASWLFLILAMFPVVAAARPARCAITVRQRPHIGEMETIRFKSRLRSKQECMVLAAMHNRNFNTHRIREKLVTFKWEGKGTGAKRIAHRGKRRS